MRVAALYRELRLEPDTQLAHTENRPACTHTHTHDKGSKRKKAGHTIASIRYHRADPRKATIVAFIRYKEHADSRASAGYFVLRQAERAVGEQNEGMGLRRPSPINVVAIAQTGSAAHPRRPTLLDRNLRLDHHIAIPDRHAGRYHPINRVNFEHYMQGEHKKHKYGYADPSKTDRLLRPRRCGRIRSHRHSARLPETYSATRATVRRECEEAKHAACRSRPEPRDRLLHQPELPAL